jgi:hypothetical protein
VAAPRLARLLPAWATLAHPIVKHEASLWRRSPGWLLLRLVLLAGVLAFIFMPASCGLLAASAAYLDDSNLPVAIAIAGGSLTGALFLAGNAAGWVVGLLASLVGATLIARERERQTWPLLRITTLTTAAILGAKLSTVFYALRHVLHGTALLRLLSLVAGSLTGALVLAAAWRGGANLAAAFDLSGLGASDRLALALYTGPVLVSVAGWVVQPYFAALYNGSLGLAASSMARSQGAAITLAFAAHIVLALGLYLPAQLLLSGIQMTIDPAGRASTVVIGGLYAGRAVLALALQVGVLAAVLALAHRRIEDMQD